MFEKFLEKSKHAKIKAATIELNIKISSIIVNIS